MSIKRGFSSFLLCLIGYMDIKMIMSFFFFFGDYNCVKQNRFNARHSIFRLEVLAGSTQKRKAESTTFRTREEWA